MNLIGAYVDMRRHNEREEDDGSEAAIAEIMELRKEFAGAFKGENVKMSIEEGRM
ncbi:MAG: hypothetical protein LBE65_03890 [Synergistaceae bacterium]|jgi:hypothetical protein|nr:hypothetical protein [Synergistaceae bacterium]